ncbi:MAG: phosphoribosylanthranilate isomerase [Lysinibacillus sp.]
MTKVKICGLMAEEHVEAAVNAGASAIGFVFAPSKRRITVERASELAKLIPGNVLKIGVFVDPSEEELKAAVVGVPLDYVQFHGDETPDFIAAQGYPSIKAMSVRSTEDVKRATAYDVDYYLFDAPGAEFKGGSGHVFDWNLLSEVGISKNKVILAGGLHSENVGNAVALVEPFMVDVSSGVETNGVKDIARIDAFMQAVKKERVK